MTARISLIPGRTSGSQGLTLDEFSGVVLAASAFGFRLDRPLINKTGIVGRFDFHLEFAIDDGLAAAPSDVAKQSIFTAVQQQLGLKLNPAKGHRRNSRRRSRRKAL
jgi:uncharacterized protein (TIGR03435 family)